jgi:hypothetical protein
MKRTFNMADLGMTAEIRTYHYPDQGTVYAAFFDGEFLDEFETEADALDAIRQEFDLMTQD